MQGNTINADVTMGGATGALLAGRYRVVRQLGQGGMGSVWLAEDEKLDGFKVAIKMLPSVLVNNKRAYAQVKAEALVSLKLSHPNIATVRAFEEESGSPFLVMDYIDGQTLDDYLAEKGKLSEDEAIRLLKPVAAALDYAHTQGVVHRDVKPGNIMIRRDGTPFVLDFGIAREIQETMTRVTGKLSSGTLLYMSPEQLNGDAPKPAQDIYSFAAMAYECLRGVPPFVRGGIEDQIKHKKPEPLDPQFTNCGQGVMAGLAKSPEERPGCCAAVLQAEVKDVDVRAPTGKVRVGVVMAMLLLIAFAAGVWWWHKTQSEAELVRQAEIARQVAERRIEEENRIAEEERLAEEKRVAEERRMAEESRKAEEKRIADIKRHAEEAKMAEEKRVAEKERQEKLEAARVAKVEADLRAKLAAERKATATKSSEERERRRLAEIEEYRRKHYPELYSQNNLETKIGSKSVIAVGLKLDRSEFLCENRVRGVVDIANTSRGNVSYGCGGSDDQFFIEVYHSSDKRKLSENSSLPFVANFHLEPNEGQRLEVFLGDHYDFHSPGSYLAKPVLVHGGVRYEGEPCMFDIVSRGRDGKINDNSGSKVAECDFCGGTGRRVCRECGPIRDRTGKIVCEYGISCPHCGGSGMRNSGFFAEPCSDCRGRGWERHVKCAGSGFLSGVCPKCKGAKTISAESN